MRITTWAEYGLICSLNLARRYGDGPVTGREIATQEKLPADLRMRRAGIVTSMRGAHGGYVLARHPGDISIRQIVSASEHTTFDVRCLTHPVAEDRCADSSNCSIRPVWMMLQQRIDDALESVHLADLLHDEPAVRTRVGLPVLQA
jgi:Rrf2 family protein